MSTSTSTIRSGFCCCTRSFNSWICCSRGAARSACVLPEFAVRPLLVRVFAPFWRCPNQLSPGRGRLISRTLHWSRVPVQSELWLVFKVYGAVRGFAPVRSRRTRVPLYGHAESVNCSVVCSTFRSETCSCGLALITSTICSNTICGTRISMIFGTVLQQWGLCGSLDRLHHWRLSLRLSCLDGRHLALHHC